MSEIPAVGDDLSTLDDATLRGIAYGRADSNEARMRAEAAARTALPDGQAFVTSAPSGEFTVDGE